MHVEFDQNTGDVKAVAPYPTTDGNSIPVPLTDVIPILKGIEPASRFQVIYNPKLKEMEFSNKNETALRSDSITDHIFEIPTYEQDDPDFIVYQDQVNTCWKFFLSKRLQQSLKESNVVLYQEMMFSVTAKGDPNVLYKTLFVNLREIMVNNYVVLPFTMQFEWENVDVSVYTPRKFDTYQFVRRLNEQ